MLFFSGQKPMARKGTCVELPVQFGHRKFSKPMGKWDVRVEHIYSDTVKLQIRIPATVGVGEWKLHIDTILGIYGLHEHHEYNRDMYILFNSWCKGSFCISFSKYEVCQIFQFQLLSTNCSTL